MKFTKPLITTALACCIASPALVVADDDKKFDFGMKVEKMLADKSEKLFGFNKPLKSSAEGSVAREPGQNAYDLIKLAKGLKATILTREAGDKADMFSFWPNENDPSHLVFCIEGGDEVIGAFDNGSAKMNPSVQTIDLASGSVTTILRGMSRCDGIRTTAWGTVLATEETSSGQAYEIIDPLGFENHTVTDRANAPLSISTVTAPARLPNAMPCRPWPGKV
jgi:hypothetical protein